jgi:hypothetical protein
MISLLSLLVNDLYGSVTDQRKSLGAEKSHGLITIITHHHTSVHLRIAREPRKQTRQMPFYMRQMPLAKWQTMESMCQDPCSRWRYRRSAAPDVERIPLINFIQRYTAIYCRKNRALSLIYLRGIVFVSLSPKLQLLFFVLPTSSFLPNVIGVCPTIVYCLDYDAGRIDKVVV